MRNPAHCSVPEGMRRIVRNHAGTARAPRVDRRAVAFAGLALGLLALPQFLTAREGYPLDVRVHGHDGKGMPGVLVRAEKATSVTGADGIGRFEVLPPGGTALEVRHPGFNDLRTNAVVRAGSPELELWLVPELLIEVELTLVDVETSNAVAGAQVSLEPVRVASSLRGPARAWTDFGGKTKVGHLPVGVYATRIAAPGFKPWSEERTFDPAARVWNVTLEPITESTIAWDARVTDARSGAGVAGAKVLLEESPGSGALAKGVSAADGAVAIKDIPIGRINRVKEGALPRGRRAVVARVEAEGYAPARLPVLLGGETQAVRLTPLAPVEETEPNNSMTEAQAVLPDSVVRCAITTPADTDAFQFDLTCDALVRIELAAAPLERYLRAYNAEGKPLREAPVGVGQPLVVDLGGRKAGRHFFTVEEWGRNGASPESFEARVATTPAPDANEPNDTLAEARLVRTGEWLRGVLLPVADVDFFRFRVERPGMVRIFIPAGHPLERYVHLLDEEGKSLAQAPASANQPLDIVCRLAQPGEYALSVEEWGRNGESAMPYEVRLDFVPDDGIDDPSLDVPPLRTVRELPLPGRLHGTIFPVGDVDTYTLRLPHAGRVVVEAIGPIEMYGRLHGIDGKVVAETPAYANNVLRLSHDADHAKALVLAIREWGDNGASTSPYMVRAWFEPAEFLETVQRNEAPDAAFPADPGDVFSGSIFPMGDQDFYRVEVPYPGRFRVEGHAPLETVLRLRRPDGSVAFHTPFYPGAMATESLVLPGSHVLHVAEWGDNACSTQPYRFGLQLDRAEPGETAPLATDAPRMLTLGQARSFTIDQHGDVDRFLFETPGGLDAVLRVYSPVECRARVYDDRTGTMIHDRCASSGLLDLPLKAENPMRFRIELREWGDNGWTLSPGFLLLAPAGLALAADRVVVEPVEGDGLDVAFRREEIKGLPRPAKVTVDLAGDGTPDVEITETGTKAFRLPEAGAFRARVAMSGTGQAPVVQEIWVEGRRRAVREGVLLTLDEPMPGQQLDRSISLVARAFSYTSKPVARVTFVLDGKLTHNAFSAPYEWPVDWQETTGKEHTLQVVAVDGDGTRAEIKRAFTLSPFMGLQPADGATLSGEQVLVSWLGTEFGKAQARWREVGKPDGEWTTVEGEDSRFRSLAFKGLEPGRKYEFHAMSGNDTSAVRSFTLVKGLAFGKSAYGANIQRDYDQRVGISVRNNGDKPLTVRLECGKPDDPLLLVGFVGEGSEDKPFELTPGEEREFRLGISAQDVLTEQHGFPVRITSDQGLSDEAMVHVSVRLPVVKLQWEDLGAAAYGMGRRYRLRNMGDTITDLALSCDPPGDILLSPSVQHGLLPGGATLDCVARPRLHDRFSGVKGSLRASGLQRVFAQPFEVRLGEGEKLFKTLLLPGGPVVIGDSPETLLLMARSAAAGSLTAERVDWSRRTDPEDTDGDGSADRWQVGLPDDDLRWVGDDTDGDGEVDFAHADVARDGVFEYSAYKTATGWVPTNLVEAWLEMGFSLRGPRDLYKEHDVDVVLNGTVIGRLRDTIPDGNFTFRIPPQALRLDANGPAADNRIGIKSKHLRGGHYAVTSEFRFKLRLTATPVWTVARSADEAKGMAARIEGVSLDGPDFSVSSANLAIVGPPELKAGMDVQVDAPIRNLGATTPDEVEVALFRFGQGVDEAVELSRVVVRWPALSGLTHVRLPWKVAGGNQRLRVVVDPDRKVGDANRVNNEAVKFVQVPGDGTPPLLKLLEPSAPANVPGLVIRIRAWADDDVGVLRVEASLDGGLWRALKPIANKTYESAGLLQPGVHALSVRATDGGGNHAQQTVTVTVAADKPQARMLFPVSGTNVVARSTQVLIECPPGTPLAAARVDGGPWHRAVVQGRFAKTTVPLRYGSQSIEAMVANAQGAVSSLKATIECTRQPHPNQPPDPGVAQPGKGVLHVGDFGPVDLFDAWNVLWSDEPESTAQPPIGAPAAQVQAEVGRDRPATLAPGTTYWYRALDEERFLRVAFVTNGVSLALLDAQDNPTCTGSGPLWAEDAQARIWGGAMELQVAGSQQRLHYAFAPAGHLLELSPAGNAEPVLPSLWTRVLEKDRGTVWWK